MGHSSVKEEKSVAETRESEHRQQVESVSAHVPEKTEYKTNSGIGSEK